MTDTFLYFFVKIKILGENLFNDFKCLTDVRYFQIRSFEKH